MTTCGPPRRHRGCARSRGSRALAPNGGGGIHVDPARVEEDARRTTSGEAVRREDREEVLLQARADHVRPRSTRAVGLFVGDQVDDEARPSPIRRHGRGCPFRRGIDSPVRNAWLAVALLKCSAARPRREAPGSRASRASASVLVDPDPEHAGERSLHVVVVAVRRRSVSG